MDINGQLSYYFANKSQLTIPGIYCAISHAHSKGTNLQNEINHHTSELTNK